MGAWVEIWRIWQLSKTRAVAPFVGAWGDIYYFDLIPYNQVGAPFVGAWVVINVVAGTKVKRLRRSLCGSVG